MKHKSIKPWVLLLVLPIPLLILIAIVQAMVRFSNQGSSNVIVNLFSLFIGMGAVFMLLGMPAWIIMLIKTNNHNKNLNSQVIDQPSAPPQPPSN